MTRGTHQVAAFASALGALVLTKAVAAPLETDPSWLGSYFGQVLGFSAYGDRLPWPAAIAYVLVAILGGVAPDVDHSGEFWARFLTSKLLGGHRHLSHSLLGAALAAALAFGVLLLLGPLTGPLTGLLWLGFVAGYCSHLLVDGLTHEGIPLLFPWGAYLGFPPLVNLRVRTGGWAEQFVVLPILLFLIAWLGFSQGRLLTSIWG